MKLIEQLQLGSDSILFNHESKHEERHFFHAHQGFEVLYIREGSGEVIVNGEMTPVQDHTLLFFQPFQLHRIRMRQQQDESYTRSVCVFDPSLLHPYLQLFPALKRFYHQLLSGTHRKQSASLEDTSRIEQLFERYDRQRRTVGREDTQETKIWFLLDLVRLLEDVFGASSVDSALVIRQKKANPHTDRIMAWVEQHYHDSSLQLDRLAHHLHLSPYHLSHLFSQDTGVTISEYWTARKLREACLLLVSTDESIGSIRRRVGYSSDSYFCQTFKTHMQMSPNQYRRSVRSAFAP
ncbi:helix-turn-helix domain-containing protein [Paenibacillus sp. GCM10023252]|uniref:helix-turn-helix domain-containing protein n=1 Tax=Paenibacillus sp. GCM10023252 TaxID=3252649 RepID=UPI00361878F7